MRSNGRASQPTIKMIDRAVILAAGRGTRMRELTADLPKPMIEVRGKPVLQHIVEGLREAGVRDCLIVVGYRADAVRDFFGDGSGFNVAIQYATQTVQDGTGRVVELARDFVDNRPFLLAYGDILVDPVNYKRLVDLREKSKPAETKRWSGFSEHAVPFYNAGLYAFRSSIFDFIAKLKPSPRGEYELTDAIRELAHSRKKVKAFELTGEWADVR